MVKMQYLLLLVGAHLELLNVVGFIELPSWRMMLYAIAAGAMLLSCAYLRHLCLTASADVYMCVCVCFKVCNFY